MSKSLKTILLFSIMFLFSFALMACSETNGLILLERAASQSIEVSDSLDEVDDSDLSDAAIDDLGVELSSSSIMNLSLNEDLTPYEKIVEIRRLHTLIVEIHFDIVDERDQTRIAFETLRTSIASARENSIILSDEDKVQVEQWVTELKEIRTELQATIGLAYAQMRDLRGTYTLENLDHILSTHQDVLDVLNLRLEKIQRTHEILAAANDLLLTYLEP
ncbi:MAG: hypothetical protein KKE16_07240 [Firmicutes bacterium]|nr:hypothetical protein [Bacillota bacterium]